MRWLRLFALTLSLAAPLAAQAQMQPQPRSDSGAMRMYDNTYQLDGATGFLGATAPAGGLRNYSSNPTTPQPPQPSALWTFGGFQVAECSPRTAPYCDAVSSATCSGSACPTSSCIFYCTSVGFAAGNCPSPGSQSSVGPGAMGYTFYNTCGA